MDLSPRCPLQAPKSVLWKNELTLHQQTWRSAGLHPGRGKQDVVSMGSREHLGIPQPQNHLPVAPSGGHARLPYVLEAGLGVENLYDIRYCLWKLMGPCERWSCPSLLSP